MGDSHVAKHRRSLNDAPGAALERELDWTRQRRPETLLSFFKGEEISRLESLRGRVDADAANIVYCVYENPFARSGGVFSVADYYCAQLASQGRNVLALSPLHVGLKSAPGEDDVRSVGRCQVPFAGHAVDVELLEHFRHGVRWILLRAKHCFTAKGGLSHTDPYVYEDPTQLLHDSLLFCAAVPYVLAELGLRENLMLHLQDWETASTALTVKSAQLEDVLGSAAIVLTCHNPYDHPLPVHALRWITQRSYEGLERIYTVYQYMLPLIDAPVTTVSRTFAAELSTDPLQREVFADHLQGVFRRLGLLGIDNGLFGQPRNRPFAKRDMQEAASGDPARILAKKKSKRRKMLQILDDCQDKRIIGHLDGGEDRLLKELADDVPVFLMFGRLDPGQKGFDVLARAIEAMPRGRCRFIIAPIVSAAPTVFFDDLKQLAAARPGEAVIYPFRMCQGYKEVMAGVSYVIMPSLYEPFGGATEPYLAGTPVVARATGGLLQQVIDIDANSAEGTGILYREHPHGLTAALWREIQSSQTPAERMAVPLYGAMVASLASALTRAADIYRSEPILYGRMLAAGHAQAERYSWERAAREYQAVYSIAVDG